MVDKQTECFMEHRSFIDLVYDFSVIPVLGFQTGYFVFKNKQIQMS